MWWAGRSEVGIRWTIWEDLPTLAEHVARRLHKFDAVVLLRVVRRCDDQARAAACLECPGRHEHAAPAGRRCALALSTVMYAVLRPVPKDRGWQVRSARPEARSAIVEGEAWRLRDALGQLLEQADVHSLQLRWPALAINGYHRGCQCCRKQTVGVC